MRPLSALPLSAVVLLGMCGCGGGQPTPPAPAAPPTATASNDSITTLCAEEDNICVALTGDVELFAVEATHPSYQVGQDNCAPDFSNCPDDPGPS